METKIDSSTLQLKDQVVSINRVTKVVKGGKNLSFSALVVVGDENGIVGYGSGKAKEVPQAIRKAVEAAKKNLMKVPMIGTAAPLSSPGLTVPTAAPEEPAIVPTVPTPLKVPPVRMTLAMAPSTCTSPV